MSEHARRNLVCSSWHKTPEGWQSWSGMLRGYTTRPFCWGDAGHAGDHWAAIETIDETVPTEVEVTNGIAGHPDFGKTTTEVWDEPKRERMTWPNKIGIPEWLVTTTKHGIEKMREHGLSDAEILMGGSPRG